MIKSLMITAALSVGVCSSAALAQTGRPASNGPVTAPAGTYQLDPKHTSVIARVPYTGGYSFSTFRFGKPSGSLVIDPARPENAQLSVSVDPASIMTPVSEKFVTDLTSAKFLNVAQFPTASFTSKSVKVSGRKAQVAGELTFMGVTKPATIEAELVGGGPALTGGQALGFTGAMKFKRSDFGFTSGSSFIGDEITVVLDGAFTHP